MTVIKIRIKFDGERYIGHGRIELLELIGQHGGRGGGAAKLTPFGAEVVRLYRDMEAKSLHVFAKPLAVLEKHLAKAPKPAKLPKAEKK
jgi:molybdate transport system regulatory protein